MKLLWNKTNHCQTKAVRKMRVLIIRRWFEPSFMFLSAASELLPQERAVLASKCTVFLSCEEEAMQTSAGFISQLSPGQPSLQPEDWFKRLIPEHLPWQGLDQAARSWEATLGSLSMQQHRLRLPDPSSHICCITLSRWELCINLSKGTLPLYKGIAEAS